MKVIIQKYCFLLFLFVCTSNALANKRLIIKYKITPQQQNLVTSGRITQMQLNNQMMQPISSSRMAQISKLSGVQIKEVIQISNGAHVVELPQDVDSKQLQKVIQKISTDPNIEYVEEDKLLKPMAVPLSNPAQWDMSASQGDNFAELWAHWNISYPAVSPGNDTIVAVIDTGYTPHSNFLSQLSGSQSSTPCTSTNKANTTCYGYQFISDCRIAGSCPSSTPNSKATIDYTPDGLDLGDYLTTAQAQASNGFFDSSCVAPSSSWHGSHVTGIIAANGYSGGSGILGGAYGASVFPVRALGKCGGYNSDVANAILWLSEAATSSTNNIPIKVINMSLGGVGACSATMQQAINSAVSAGIIVVVAAGNATVNQDGSSYTIHNVANINPANCKNVISVSAKNYNNELSWYSSYGNTTITASGGGSFGYGGNNIYSTFWASEESYAYSSTNSTYIEYQGTSQATPHVSAVIADLITYFNQIKIQYSASNLIDILQSSSSALTNTSNLSDITSGQGGVVPNRTLNAQNALIYAINNYKILAQPSSLTFTSLEPQVVVFTNTTTKEMNVLTAAIINSSNVGLTIVADECSNISLDVGASCSVTVSPTKLGITQATLKLTNDGKTINLVPISVNDPISTNSSGAGGGGCSATQNGDDASLLFILLAISVIYYARRRLYKNN
ncbi:MAG: S8 family serine peptidase [Proteobacteria bacterium]|nr:S8 family serine peptidase [Pseudomonadota bacterium]